MIEDTFKKWLEFELQSDGYNLEELNHALTGDYEAKSFWHDFEILHRNELKDMVRTQIKAILRK